MNVLSIAILASAFLLLFALAEILYIYFKFKAEVTRKIVHIGTGILTFTFPYYFISHWEVLILCTSFLLLLVISKKYNLLKSINNVSRKTYGSTIFPIIVYLLFYAYCLMGIVLINIKPYAIYFIPLLLLSICDPLAALCGKKYPIKNWPFLSFSKSMGGTLGFFISALLLNLIFIYKLNVQMPFPKIVVSSIITSFLTSIAELLSPNGWDNFTIPLVAFFSIYFIIG